MYQLKISNWGQKASVEQSSWSKLVIVIADHHTIFKNDIFETQAEHHSSPQELGAYSYQQ